MWFNTIFNSFEIVDSNAESDFSFQWPRTRWFLAELEAISRLQMFMQFSGAINSSKYKL